MIIIFDTNSIFSDYLLQSNKMRALALFLSDKENNAQLCIPEVVLQEIIRQFSEKLDESLRDYRKSSAIFNMVNIQTEPNHIDIDLEKAKSDFEEKLKKRMTELQTKILPLPKIDIQTLLSRDLEKRRPFDINGKGFRDALIWESIVAECTSHEEEIIFITEDSDFLEQKGKSELHNDLVLDLEKVQVDPKRIQIFNFDMFYKKYLEPTLEPPKEEPNTDEFNGIDILTRYGWSVADQIFEKLPSVLTLSSAHVSRVSFLRWPENVKTTDFYKLEDHTLLIELYASVVYDSEVNLSEDDFQKLVGITKGKTILLQGHTWDENSRSLFTKLRLHNFLKIELIYDTTFDTLVNLEVTEIAFEEFPLGKKQTSKNE